jgi:hypothetical protein
MEIMVKKNIWCENECAWNMCICVAEGVGHLDTGQECLASVPVLELSPELATHHHL